MAAKRLGDHLGAEGGVPVVAGVARLVLQDESVRRQEMAARRQGCREPLGDAGERIAVGEVVQDFRADDQVEAMGSASSNRSSRRQSTLPWARQRSRARCKRGLGNVGGDEMADARRQQLGEPALRAGELHRLADRLVRQQAERAAILQLLVGLSRKPTDPRCDRSLPSRRGGRRPRPLSARQASAGLPGRFARPSTRPSAISEAMARSPEPAPPVAANAASVRQAFTSACRLRTGTARRRSLAVATAKTEADRRRRGVQPEGWPAHQSGGPQQFGQAHRIEREPHDVAGREAAQGRRLAMADDARAAAELYAHPVDAGVGGESGRDGQRPGGPAACRPRPAGRSGGAG